MSRGNFLVKAENISKKFCRRLRRSLWYGLKDLTSELVGSGGERKLRRDEFWALEDISFEVKQGEVLGVIGRNGAGKTTLLRLLNGLIKPDGGRIRLKGRVGALIALGAGFNPILTGRENIYINAAVLGIRKKEVDKRLDAIVDFAEVWDFIDTPVQSYSSGMRVRLGFAVASHLAPDVLLVDEVLAVGDYAFREKSFARMTEICNSGAGVIFVSHSMSAILTICHNALWLEGGKIQMLGPADEVVKSYLHDQEERASRQSLQKTDEHQPQNAQALYGQMQIKEVELANQSGTPTTSFHRGDDLHVRIHYEALERIQEPHFVAHVGTEKEVLFSADMLRDNIAPAAVEGKGKVECIFKGLPLLPNRYLVSVLVMGKTSIVKIVYPAYKAYFEIGQGDESGQQNVMSVVRRSGVIPVENTWVW